MLTGLSIRDVVLIDKLDLSFDKGLTVLTGETGAGKSILLDSLSLSTGARADTGLVRAGQDRLSVTASFALRADHPALAFLAEEEIEHDDGEDLLFKRTVSAEGRSKAVINGQPVPSRLMRAVGEKLVEIHGQFENHALLSPATHRAILDLHGKLYAPLAKVKKAWGSWQTAKDRRIEAEKSLADTAREEEFLRHALNELEKIAPQEMEEEELATRRSFLMNGEKLIEGVNQAIAALTQTGEPGDDIRKATGFLSQVAAQADGAFDTIIEGLDRAAIELSESHGLLENMAEKIDLDPQALEEIEERLFALRALARKHQVTVDELPDVQAKIAEQLSALDGGALDIKSLKEEEEKARIAYIKAAKILSEKRQEAADSLDRAISAELPPLKLEKARFETQVTPAEEIDWSENGTDHILFAVAMNPGTPFAPLHKAASGGEMARLMLALKVILAADGSVPVMIFDEVDTGIGGATASAVGERLAMLAETCQVLVVTHSPQVAARGSHHFRIQKTEKDGTNTTSAIPLDSAEREEEIARMLSGKNITTESRAAARQLLEQA